MLNEYAIVLTTMGADADCAGFAETLVREHLAACVNVLPEMVSTYRWKGSIETDRERQLTIKTSANRVEALMARIRQIHPYEVPEILVVKVEGGANAYLRWIDEVTAPPA